MAPRSAERASCAIGSGISGQARPSQNKLTGGSSVVCMISARKFAIFFSALVCRRRERENERAGVCERRGEPRTGRGGRTHRYTCSRQFALSQLSSVVRAGQGVSVTHIRKPADSNVECIRTRGVHTALVSSRSRPPIAAQPVRACWSATARVLPCRVRVVRVSLSLPLFALPQSAPLQFVSHISKDTFIPIH